jgi:hypothetical protein
VSGENHTQEKTLSWLLEENHPGVRYLALRDLVGLEESHPDLRAAQASAHRDGPIADILNAMLEPGYWVVPGPGYGPKYYSTVWSIINLGQLGASADFDPRIPQACRYLIDHALTEHGQFSSSGTPGSTVDCLQGNLLTALLDIGFEDRRLVTAFEWMARSITGEGVAPMGDTSTPIRYYAGNCGPDFACGANNNLPCAWGAVKTMLAFSKLPQEKRTPLIEKAVERGIAFLLGVDPLEATYPSGYSHRPSRNWWKFGFPVFYVTDLLQNVETLVRLGLEKDPRLSRSLIYIQEKQDQDGRWRLDYDYTGKTWVDFGEKKQPNKWVTYRAAWVLNNADQFPH